MVSPFFARQERNSQSGAILELVTANEAKCISMRANSRKSPSQVALSVDMVGLSGRFQRIHETRRHIKACLLMDLLEAGGAGDVDLRQAVTNHVQAHQ